MNPKYEKLVNEINLQGDKLQYLSQDQLIASSEKIIKMVSKEKYSQENIIDAFALIKEVSWRTLGLKHFNTQLMGGLILNEGKIVEMKTGEGKTLVSTLPAYYNASLKKVFKL